MGNSTLQYVPIHHVTTCQGSSRDNIRRLTSMAYHRGQNSTFEFDVVVYNFYQDLQLNIQVSYFSTPIVDLTLFDSRFNFVLRSIQHSSLRNSTFNFRKYPTASQSMRVSVGSANYQNEFLVSKETVVLRLWERSKQKFGFIKRVDKG